MVYESSTRRIYSSSSPRPVISTSYSYSPVGPIPIVTKVRRQPHLVLAYTPGTSKGHIINPLAIPRVAHRRLVSVSPPPHRALNGQNYYDMLESGISGHFGNRIILVRYRPTPPPVPQSKVLYIEDVTDTTSYGKETRLLRRELSPTPSMVYGSPWDTSSALIPISRPLYGIHNIPLRSASEVKEIADLRRLYVRERNPDVGYSPLNKALLYRMPMPHYVDPTLPQNYYIGRGNLACLSFAGGRPIPKRRRFYPDYEDKVRDEVIFRSFYSNLRDAAAMGRNAGKRPIYQPIYYSRKTILGEENIPKRVPKESKWVERALANEKPPTPRPNKASTKAASVATETVVVPPRKESLKMERTPATPPPVQPVNVTLPGPRKSITEIIKEDLPRVESLPEEKVTVKMPRDPEPAPPTPVEARTEETVVISSKNEPRQATPPPPREPTPPPPKEPTPPPKEPTPPPKEPTPPPKEPTPPPPKEPTPPPKEPTPPPKEPTPPPKEPTPPPKEPTPPPKEPTPPPKELTPPPAKEATPPPQETEIAATPQVPAAEEPAAESPAPAEAASVSEASPPAASASEQASHDEASNKGEVEDIVEEDITLDEVCDVEENNDLEIESDDQEASQSAAESVEVQVESPQVTEGSSANEPANQDVVPPVPVSIVVADIDGPVPTSTEEEAPAVQEEPLTVEQIQAEAERRRAEFAQLLEEHAELVTTVTKLERVAVIVSKSCAEALAQQETEQQPPPSTPDSQKSK